MPTRKIISQLTVYSRNLAVEGAQKRLERHTKAEIINMFHLAIRIISLYSTIRYRYDCLQTAIETVKNNTQVSRKQLDELEKLYEECNDEGWYGWKDCVRRFDGMTDSLPWDVWLK